MEKRVDDQGNITQLEEEENLILKERLFLMEMKFDKLVVEFDCIKRDTTMET